MRHALTEDVLRRTSGFLALVLACTISASPASTDLLQAALDPNPSLNAYTATAELDVTLHAGLPVRKRFTGTMYYNRPTERLVLDNAKGALSKYKDMRTTLPSKDEMLRDYTLLSTGDDGAVSRFVFSPKAPNGRVQSVSIAVTDATRLIHDARWKYANGSSLVITPQFENVRGYHLALREDIAARFPGYSVDATLNLSNYTFAR